MVRGMIGHAGLRYQAEWRKRGRVKKPKRHDVGGGRMLTVAEIAAETGTSRQTIHARIKAGCTQSELIYGRDGRRRDEWPPRHHVGGGRRLTVKEIAAETGLSAAAVSQRIHRGAIGAALLMSRLWTDEEIEIARRMRAEGAAWVEVADALGRSAMAVQLKLRRSEVALSMVREVPISDASTGPSSG